MKLTISHVTRYRFEAPVPYGLQQLRKTPKATRHQTIEEWKTVVEGGRIDLEYDDHHNNHVHLVRFEKGTQELLIRCEGLVSMVEGHGVVGPHRGPAPLWLYSHETERTKPGPGVRALLKDLEPAENDLARLHGLMAAIHAAVAYEVGASESDWTAEDALSAGRGVCQDHTHVFLAAARRLGYPARYVSGYLMLDDRVEQDAMHAWAEAHVDGLGWVGFDVSNGMSPDQRYVRVATGLDYRDAAPVTGAVFGGAAEALDVQIAVAQQ
ncbi:transglutaminase family protein [Cognatishimia sp. F0-27]|uniref:transglutaminase family protein n=1 Tax=Cognatishimia sp. F0-27 TaxID=2816855 RepID=UPI001D0CCE9E|nr:transglutaminase family protein [Cognatishimia sp. F0-27]MCC1492881.1 transglutaminase family protein [Cognatishimia sp. F0-27]